MYRLNATQRLVSSLLLLVLVDLDSGCPGGGGGDTTASATDSTSTTDGTDTAGTTVGSDTSDTDLSGGLVECPERVPPGDFGFAGDDQVTEVNFETDCSEADFPLLHEQYVTNKFTAAIYRPDVDAEWPDQDLPLVIFAHGNGHRYYGYDSLFSEITRLGFVVISLDFPNNLDVKTRGEQMLCASRWASDTWDESHRLDGNLIFAGHSRGGEAVVFATGLRDILASPLDVLDLRATLSVAPSTFLSIPLPNTGAPFLGLQGSTDEDSTSGVIVLYEGLGVEQDPPSTLNGKWMVWLYDIRHDEFGGRCPMPPPIKLCLDTPKGRAAVRNYFSSFLQWHYFGQSSFRRFFVGPDTEVPTSPDSLTEPNFWSEWGGIPRIFRASVEDSADLAGERQVLDAFENGDLQTSTANGEVQIEGGLNVLVEGGAIQNVANTVHDTGVLYLQWDADDQPIIKWSIPVSLRDKIAAFSHFEFRVANVINSIGPLPECVSDSNPPPSIDIVFVDSAEEEFSFNSTSAGEIPVQDVRMVDHPTDGPICAGTNFLRTLRVPLERLCAEGLALNELATVEFRLGTSVPGHLMIDSLEFTRSPFDDSGECGPPLACIE